MIPSSTKPELAHLVQRLIDMEETFVEESISNYSLSLTKADAGNTLLVEGNTAGLVNLARMVLDVASKEFSGAHCHFDTAGIVEVAEMDLVVSLKPTAWDS